MKRWIMIAAVALMAIPAAAQYQEAYPSYIQVNGRAEKEITPYEFYLSIVVNERESKGKITVEQQQKEMIAALRKLGIDIEKQLKVANMSSELFRKRSSVTTAKYQLKVAAAAQVSKVYEALDGIGISNVSILRVSHSKIDEYKEQVRIEAMRNAQQSARTMAEAVGQTVGKCFYIYDSNSDVMPAFYNNAVMTRGMKLYAESDAAAPEEEESLDFKTIKLRYDVQAKFVLE